MNLEQYSELALRTNNDIGTRLANIMHAALGIAGESGEVVDIVKKTFAYGKPLVHNDVVEEMGDLCWYINLMLHHLEFSWEEMLEMNIKKLEVRYPGLRFNADHAINRDVEAEQIAMNLPPEGSGGGAEGAALLNDYATCKFGTLEAAGEAAKEFSLTAQAGKCGVFTVEHK